MEAFRNSDLKVQCDPTFGIQNGLLSELMIRRVAILGIIPLAALTLSAQSAEVLVQRAKEDTQAGHYSQAEKELSQAVALGTTKWNLWYDLGLLRVQLGKNENAVNAFEKARALDPRQALPYFGLGLSYMKSADYEKALEAYRDGLARNPNDVEANQNYAFLLTQNGDFRGAVEPLKRLKNLQPADASARTTLIGAYLRAGLRSEAETETDDLLDSNILTLQQGLALAKLLLAGRQMDSAQHVLDSLKSNWPSSAEAHGELGLLLAEKEQFKEAAEELGQAVQIDPNSEKYSLGYGEALLNSAQYLIAFPFLTEAGKRFPNQLNFQYQLAFTDIDLDRHQDAVSILEALANKRPDSGKVQFLLGAAYELSGESQKGEEHYRTAIQLSPQEPGYYRALAVLLQKQSPDPEHLTESIQLLRKSLTLDPTDVESKIELARCLEKQGELDEAATLLEQAVASEPGLRRAHTALAEVYRRQKKLPLAEKEQAIAAQLEDEKITRDSEIGNPHSTGGP